MRAVVIVMVEPPDNSGMLAEWQWPQAEVRVSAKDEKALLKALPVEVQVAARKCLALGKEPR